ncbi:hypothetical protein [Actinomadura macrotermitis]|uniref:Uncharacterized protein n=1 Tax=Actinomadura macrotermitis TaxID=2585200 RepID=A0A7K0BU77_9ACTN|nr:hypothetical protein [Actinomadura macrotermitis]MQY04750.1 hypothetical protein [Actinomadura macrotermitis]
MRNEPRPDVDAPEGWSAALLQQAAVALARLRAEYPGLGFVADPVAGVWFAVDGRDFLLQARTGIKLRERLLAAQVRGARRGQAR